LLRALLGLIPSVHGNISLNATKIAYVPQRLPAVSGIPISVSESVATGLLDGSLNLFRKNRSKQRVSQVLSTLEISSLTKKSLSQLSGGQLRKVMIAKALVSNPDLLLLDEPTSGLDQASQSQLIKTLKELKNNKVTIVLVTHELGIFTDLVDKAIVLDRNAKNNVSYMGKLPIPISLDPESHHSEELKSKVDESVLGLNS
jgi:zinc transport system ATP-binding protein